MARIRRHGFGMGGLAFEVEYGPKYLAVSSALAVTVIIILI
jgi:hypothetical protein